MTAKIDLTDLFELFAKTEEKPPVAPPVSPEARRWRRVFADNVAAVLRVRANSIEARKVAYENTVTAFLDATHPNTDPNRCAHCGGPETPDAVLQPIGWGDPPCMAARRLLGGVARGSPQCRDRGARSSGGREAMTGRKIKLEDRWKAPSRAEAPRRACASEGGRSSLRLRRRSLPLLLRLPASLV